MSKRAKTVKSTKKSSSMKLESLEPRLLMSAADDFQSGIDQLDSSLTNWVATYVNPHATEAIDHLFTVDGSKEMQVVRLSDLLDTSSIQGIGAELETGIKSVVQSAVQAGAQQNPAKILTLAEVAAALNAQQLQVNAAGGAHAVISASEQAGKIALGIDLDWLTQKNATSANLGRESGISSTLEGLQAGARLHLTAQVDANGTVVASDTYMQADARYSQSATAGDVLNGTLALKQLDVTGETNPDASFGIRLDSSQTAAMVSAADLDFQIDATSQANVPTGLDASAILKLTMDAQGNWQWSSTNNMPSVASQMPALSRVGMSNVLQKIGELSNWLESLSRTDSLAQNFSGLLAQNANQVLPLAGLLHTTLGKVLNPQNPGQYTITNPPGSLQDMYRGTAPASISYDAQTQKLTIPFDLNISGNADIVLAGRLLTELSSVAQDQKLRVTANAGFGFSLVVDLSSSSLPPKAAATDVLSTLESFTVRNKNQLVSNELIVAGGVFVPPSNPLNADLSLDVAVNGNAPIRLTIPQTALQAPTAQSVVNAIQAAIGSSSLSGFVEARTVDGGVGLKAVGTTTALTAQLVDSSQASFLNWGTALLSASYGDLKVTLDNGTAQTISLRSVALSGTTTVQQAMQAIAANSGNTLTYDASSNALRATSGAVSSVAMLHESSLLRVLGLVVDRNGIIQALAVKSGQLSNPSIQILNPELDLKFAVSTPNGIDLGANFGPLGVRIKGSVGMEACATLALQNASQPIAIEDLNDWVSDAPSSLKFQTTLKDKNGTVLTAGQEHTLVDLNVEASTGLGGSLSSLGTIKLKANLDATPSFAKGWGLVMSTQADLDAKVADLKTQGMALISTKLGEALLQLEGIATHTFMGQTLPLIDTTVGELIPLAETMVAIRSEISKNPPETLQQLNALLSKALGIQFVFGLNQSKQLDVVLAKSLQYAKTKNAVSGLGFAGFEIGGDAEIYAQALLDFKAHFAVDYSTSTVKSVVFSDQTYANATVTLVGGPLSFGMNLGVGNQIVPVLQVYSESGETSSISMKADLRLGIDPANVTVDAASLLAHIQFSKAQVDAFGKLYVKSPIGDAGYIGIGEWDSAAQSVKTGTWDLRQLSGGMGLEFFKPTQLGGNANPSPINPSSLVVDAHNLNVIPQTIGLFDKLKLAVNGVDQLLNLTQSKLTGNLMESGFRNIPFVGDSIINAADFITQFQKDFVTPLRKYANSAIGMDAEGVAKFLTETLNGLNPSLLQDLGALPTGSGWAEKAWANTYQLAGKDLIHYNESGDMAEWHFQLKGTYSLDGDADFDLGLKGLGLKGEGGVNLTFDWVLDLGFGINQTGAYLIMPKGDELQLTLHANMDPNSSVEGSLGFLQMNASVDPLMNKIELSLGVDLNDRGMRGEQLSVDNQSDEAEEIQLSEINRLIRIDAALTADVELGLIATLGVANGGSTAGVPEFPELSARFVFDWSASRGNITGEFHKVGFDQIELDLGKYVSSVIKPMAQKIQKILDPFQPILKFLDSDMPVLDSLPVGEEHIKVRKFIEMLTPPGQQQYWDMLDDIIDLNNLIGKFANFATTDKITIDDYFWVDDLRPGTENDSGKDFLLGNQIRTFDPITQLPNGYLDLQADAQIVGDFANKFIADPNTLANEANKILGTLGTLTQKSQNTAGRGWVFPLFEDPSAEILGMLMGRQARLVVYDMSPLDFKFDHTEHFPIIGPLWADIGFHMGATIDLEFGYDTLGLVNWKDSGYSDYAALLDGFYISDMGPYGSATQNEDVNELTFYAGITGGASICGTAGFAADVDLVCDLDLYDPNNDERVRFSELEQNFKGAGITGIFDAIVKLQLRAYAYLGNDYTGKWEVDLYKTSMDLWKWEASRKLISAQQEGGNLVVNSGPNAAKRTNEDKTDNAETIVVTALGGQKVKVSINGKGGDIEYEVPAGKKLIIDGGAYVDTITFNGTGASFDVEILGGQGDDKIDLSNFKTTGQVWIRGQAGGDFITGSQGQDYIFGDEGELRKDANNNWIAESYPDPEAHGKDTLKGGDGDDFIFGGGGEDDIAGGTGADTIFGDFGRTVAGVVDRTSLFDEGGTDTILGEDGDDKIYGGAGDDQIDAGKDNDIVLGDKGHDTIFGGSGDDKIWGSDGIDIIFGDRPDLTNNFVIANSGNTAGILPWKQLAEDITKGKASLEVSAFGISGYTTTDSGTLDGNDTIYGEQGSDILFGDGGSDTATLGGIDTIYGGIENDFIDGDAGRDNLYGDTGEDVLYGGFGGDRLEGGADDDIVFGENGLASYSSKGSEDYLPTGDGNKEERERIWGRNLAQNFGIKRDAVSKTDSTEQGDDTIETGNGSDFVDGQSGNDKYNMTFSGGAALNYTNIADSGADVADKLTAYGTLFDDDLLIRASNDGLGVVALLPQSQLEKGNNAKANIERVNFWKSNDGTGTGGVDILNVNAGFGNDKIQLDGTVAATTVNGEAGDDTFMVGQMYKSTRSAENIANNIADVDNFATDETTEGFLSHGVNNASSITGGSGNDTFQILHASAALSVSGNSGDDTFTVNSFVNTELKPIMNGPMSVDGGAGNDAYTVTGSEGGDVFVIGDGKMVSTGVSSSVNGIEKMQADGGAGDDTFNILSTQAGENVEVYGGLGNDTVNNGGSQSDIIVKSADYRGHTGVISHTVIAASETGFLAGSAPSLKVNVIDSNAGETEVFFWGPDGRICDPSISLSELVNSELRIGLSRKPVNGESIQVTITIPSVTESDLTKGDRGLLLSTTGNAQIGTSVVLTLDENNCQNQASPDNVVYINAPADCLLDGVSLKSLSITATSTGTTKIGQVRMVSAQVENKSVTQDSGLIGFTQRSIVLPATGSTTFAMELSQAPADSDELQVWVGDSLQSLIKGTDYTVVPVNGKTVVTLLSAVSYENQLLNVHYSSSILVLDGETSLEMNYPTTAGVVLSKKLSDGSWDTLTQGQNYWLDDTKIVFIENGRPMGVKGEFKVELATGSTQVVAGNEGREGKDALNGEILIIPSEGSTDVIEGFGYDYYDVNLSKMPLAGTVEVTATALQTRYSDSIDVQQQVEITSIIDLKTNTVVSKMTWDSSRMDGSGKPIGYRVMIRAVDDGIREDDNFEIFPSSDRTISNLKGGVYADGAGTAGTAALIGPMLIHYGKIPTLSDETNKYEDYSASITTDGLTVSILTSDLPSGILSKLVGSATTDWTQLAGCTLTATSGVAIDSQLCQITSASESNGVLTLEFAQGFQVVQGAGFRCLLGVSRQSLFVDEMGVTDRLFVNNMDNANSSTTTLSRLSSQMGTTPSELDQKWTTNLDALRFNNSEIAENGINFARFEFAEINLGKAVDQVEINAAINRTDGFQTYTVVNTGNEEETSGDSVVVKSYEVENLTKIMSGSLMPDSSVDENAPPTFIMSSYQYEPGMSNSVSLVGCYIDIQMNQVRERRTIIDEANGVLILDRQFILDISAGVTFSIVSPMVTGGVLGQNFECTPIVSGNKIVSTTVSLFASIGSANASDVLVLIDDAGRMVRNTIKSVNAAEQKVEVFGAIEDIEFTHFRIERQMGDDQLVINTQAGNDSIVADDSRVKNSLIVFGGIGEDTIEIGNSSQDVNGNYIFGDRGQLLVKDANGNVVTMLGSDDNDSDYTTASTKNDSDLTGKPWLQTDGASWGFNEMESKKNDYDAHDEVTIHGNKNFVIAGGSDDEVQILGGENIVIGDSGKLTFSPPNTDLLRGDANVTYVTRAETIYDSTGGKDVISTDDGSNIIIGGTDSDVITTQDGDDIIIGDGGYVNFNQKQQVLIASNSGRNAGYDVGSAGDDIISAGTGNNTVLGGLGNDSIVTGYDDQSTAVDLRDRYSNDSDVVLGDNGYRTFQGSGLDSYMGESPAANAQVTESSTLSFNFRGSTSRGINANEIAGATGYAASNWNNIVAPSTVGTFGNDPKEIIYDAQGKRLDGLALSYGGSEEHRLPISVPHQELLAYGLQNYNPETIVNADTGLLSKGDGYLMGGGLRSTAPNSQCLNKLEVEMDGLSKYFSKYTVVVYIDAPAEVSSLIQNPQDSALGMQIGRGESVRKVAIAQGSGVNLAEKESFYIDDPSSTSNPTYSQFAGQYRKATAKDALQATMDGYRNYVVFEGLTDDRFVVTITDGFINVNFNGRDLASIAGIQIIGEYHKVDKVESSRTEAGGNDVISTGGGDDVVIGGLGNDNIATFGDVRDGIVDADTVIGDNGAVTLMNRPTKMRPEAEVVNAMTTGVSSSLDLTGVGMNDIIVTGNGNDVVFGGEGNDRIHTERQDEMVAGIANNLVGTPDALSYEHLRDLQSMDARSISGHTTQGKPTFNDDIQVLSLNFSYSYNNSSLDDNDLKIANDQFAGVVQASTWNNVKVNDSLNPSQYPNPYDAITFKKGDGSNLDSGFNINLRAREYGNLTQLQADRSNGHDQITPDSDNSRMYEGYLWGQKQQTLEVKLNGIRGKLGTDTYDVYVYIDGDDERTDTDCWLYEVAGTGQASKYVNDWRGQSFNGEFREVTATTKPTVDNGLNINGNPNQSYIGNYIVFRNVNVQDFQISIKNVLNSDQTKQQPLNMPSIAAIQVVGKGREKVNTNRTEMVNGYKLAADGTKTLIAANSIAAGGDYDKDVVVGDNGYANFTLGIPFGLNDQPEVAQNKAFTVVGNPSSTITDATAASQSDYIVTGRNQDLVIGGNGADAIDAGMGADVVFADNGTAQMVDYNPIGVRLPNGLQMLDNQSQVQDNDAYIGRPNTDANQFLNKLGSNYDQVAGIKLTSSTQGGNDIVDAGQDNDLVFGQEGDDILIDNEGKDDVMVGNAGNNSVTNPRVGLYTDVNQYLGDLTSVLATLDNTDKGVVNQFASNDFGAIQSLGDIIKGKGSATPTPPTTPPTGTGVQVFSNSETTLTLAANEEIEIYSTENLNAGSNILLAITNVGTMIPSLQYSWVTGTNTTTVNGQTNSWYYTVDIPNTPNTPGKYVIRIKALSAGTFRVRLGY